MLNNIENGRRPFLLDLPEGNKHLLLKDYHKIARFNPTTNSPVEKDVVSEDECVVDECGLMASSQIYK